MMLTSGGQQQDYRPDIDGLRAVAVAGVIAYHAFPSLVPGGFVGVDVFFVISGFLISGIIFRDLASGSFSFCGILSPPDPTHHSRITAGSGGNVGDRLVHLDGRRVHDTGAALSRCVCLLIEFRIGI